MPVALAGDGVAIVDVVVFAVMLLLIAMLWLLLQARAPVSGVPIVGTVGVSLIDGLRNNVQQLAFKVEDFLNLQQQIVTGLWSKFVSNIINPAFAIVQDLVVSQGLQLEQLVKHNVPLLEAELGATTALVVDTIRPELVAVISAERATELYVTHTLAVDLAEAQNQLTLAAHEIDQLKLELANASGQLASTMATVAALAVYLPLLHALAGFETATGAGVSQLEQLTAAQQARLAALQAQLEKLLGLSAITALGAVAIENLVRVARDPCNGCLGANLNGYEQRFQALELFGEP